MQAGQYVPDDDHLTLFENGLTDRNTQIEQSLKQTQTGEATAREHEADVNAQKAQWEMQFGTGQFADAKYRDILSRLSSHQSVTDQDLVWAKGYELSKRETTTSSDTLGVTSTTTRGPAGLATVRSGRPTTGTAPGAFAARPALTGGTPQGTPSAAGLKNSLVDMVGQYKLNPSVLQSMIVKHPDVIAAVQQKYTIGIRPPMAPRTR
jgi:hypothetical protein